MLKLFHILGLLKSGVVVLLLLCVVVYLILGL
jgi:hypothetical protein